MFVCLLNYNIKNMNITTKKIVSFLSLLMLFYFQVDIFLSAENVYAGSLWENQEGRTEMATAFGETNPDSPVDVRVVVGNVVKAFLGFMGIIFLILNIMAGFKWMTAGGNEQAVTDAKNQLLRAAIGLSIILTAYSITYYVTERLVQATTGSVW